MKQSPRILVAIVALLALPAMASAQSFAPSAERGIELVDELDLRADQEGKSKALLTSARKEAIRARAELEIASIDLTSELGSDNPDEVAVAKLITKMSNLEGQLRRSQVIAWVKVRKLLSEEQRLELRRLQDLGGQSLVKSQGEFLNPFQHINTTPNPRKRGDEIENPFAQSTAEEPSTKLSNARGGLSVATSTPARVFVDGELRGVSPIAIRVGVGTHEIRAEFLDGSKATEQRVEVSKNRRTRIRMNASKAAKDNAAFYGLE